MPAQLQAALTRMGVAAHGAGGWGAGRNQRRRPGAGQLQASRRDTALCVVALGGNDLLQGIEPRVTKANLRAILQSLRDRRIGVVLVGIGAPTLFGQAYAREFNAVYPALAPRVLGAALSQHPGRGGRLATADAGRRHPSQRGGGAG